MPISRDIYPERGNNNPETINLSGRFALSSSPAVVAGRGYTVTYAPTGLFSIVTSFQWKNVVGWGLGVLSSTLTDQVQVVSFDAATRTIVLQFQSAGSANAGTTAKQIGFRLALTNSGLPVK